MKTEELRSRILQDEDRLVERKTTGSSSEVIKTLVAFANSVEEGEEAVLFIGQRDDKTIVGVDNPDKAQDSVRQWCLYECYPPITAQSQVLPIDGHQVLAVVVGPSKERPHFTGKAYKRIGARTEEASSAMLDELIASRNEKAGAILRHKGEVITVDFEHRLTGSNPPFRVIPEDCRIEGASAHSVELKIIARGELRSIGMERIIITKDVKNFRPLRLRVRLLQ